METLEGIAATIVIIAVAVGLAIGLLALRGVLPDYSRPSDMCRCGHTFGQHGAGGCAVCGCPAAKRNEVPRSEWDADG